MSDGSAETGRLTHEVAAERLSALSQSLAEWPAVEAIRELARSWDTRVYLVGGMIRDCVLGRKLADLDLALPESALEFAMELAESMGGTFVVLDEIHGAGRVVLTDGPTVDVSDFRRSTIEEDCKARDLTCNGMAADLERFLEGGADAVMDPVGAVDDLSKGIIRTYRPENLADDPLRILRVFRYSATLRFPIEGGTLEAVEQHARSLNDVAAERVMTEFDQIFASHQARTVLPAMLSTGVLKSLFPFYTSEELSAWVGRAAWIEKALNRKPPLPGRDASRADRRGFRLVTMLAATKPGNRVADLIAALRLSRRIVSRLMHVSMALVSVRRLVYEHPLEQDFIAITARILLSLGSDRLAPWLILAADGDEERVLSTLERAEKLTVEKILPIADGPPLITGGELAQAMDRAPGPWISEALESLFFERIWGHVTDRDSALAYVTKYLAERP